MSKVEVRKLGDIEDLGLIEMGRGNVISKNDILSTPGNYPVYSSSSSNNGEIGRYGKYMFDDERITWSIDGGGKLFYRNNIKYSVTNVCGWLKVLDEKKIISKYLYYLLINQWQKLNFNYSHKAHPSVIRNEYYVPNIEIKVQEKIVKILDSFTNLIDALNEELSLRQKQFEYYREKLLTFDESNYVKISSICKRIVSGGTPKTTIDRYYQGNIPWLRTEEVDFCYVYETKKHISEEAIANSSTKMIPVNCVIIAMYGATAAKC